MQTKTFGNADIWLLAGAGILVCLTAIVGIMSEAVARRDPLLWELAPKTSLCIGRELVLTEPIRLYTNRLCKVESGVVYVFK